MLFIVVYYCKYLLYHLWKFQASTYSYLRENEKYVSNCGRCISRPEVNFTKLFHVTLDLIHVSAYTIYECQVNHMRNKRVWGIENQESVLTINGSWRFHFRSSYYSLILWYYKRNLIYWYRFNFKVNIMTFSTSTITSGDDRKFLSLTVFVINNDLSL